MKLTKEEIEMCQTAVGIITDTHTMTDENMAKWDMLYEKLEKMLQSLPTQAAPDGATPRRRMVAVACPNCETMFGVELSPTAPQVRLAVRPLRERKGVS